MFYAKGLRNVKFQRIEHFFFFSVPRCFCVIPEIVLQGCNEETENGVVETIFSPSFHVSKVPGGEIASGGR